MTSPRKHRARPARTPSPTDCDVRLDVSGDTVKAIAITRHLLNASGEIWCGAESTERTSTPLEATCRRCFSARLKEMQRQARLRGDHWLLADDDYDDPFERMSLAQVDARPLQLLEELSAGTKTRKAKRKTLAMPGSAAKQMVLEGRVSRNESTSHPGDRTLDFLAAGLRVENSRNGATLVVGVVAIAGPSAEAAHQERNSRVSLEELREHSPSVWDWLSGEAVLRGLEERIGRPLHAAARTLAAWPWGKVAL